MRPLVAGICLPPLELEYIADQKLVAWERRVRALRRAAEGARAGGGEPLDAARAGAAEEKGDGGDYGEGYYCGLEGDVDADAEMAACVEDGCWDSDSD